MFKPRELLVEMTPTEDFFEFNPTPTWISRVFNPPLSENFQNPILRMGVCFFSGTTQ